MCFFVKKTLVLALVIAFFSLCEGQSLIAPVGGFEKSATGSLSFSVGEIGAALAASSDGVLSEGQQQPDPIIESSDSTTALRVPEGITPNGDGKNDLLIIDGLENWPQNELKIVNRWGDAVFSAKPYASDWGGRASGSERLLPAGAYYFWLWPAPSAKPLKGVVHLIY